jgi:hypothetical protein
LQALPHERLDPRQRGGHRVRKLHGHRAEAADGNGDQIHFRQIAQQCGGFQQIFQTNVVRRQGRWKIAGVAGPDKGNRAHGPVIRGGINEDDVLPVAEESEQMKSASATIHEFGPVGKAFFLQLPDGGNPNPLVPHQEVPNAKNKGFVHVTFWSGRYFFPASGWGDIPFR